MSTLTPLCEWHDSMTLQLGTRFYSNLHIKLNLYIYDVLLEFTKGILAQVLLQIMHMS